MTMEERLSKFEIAIAAVSGVILFVATLTGPGLDPGLSRGRLAITHARQSRRLAGLETALKTAQEHSSAAVSRRRDLPTMVCPIIIRAQVSEARPIAPAGMPSANVMAAPSRAPSFVCGPASSVARARSSHTSFGRPRTRD